MNKFMHLAILEARKGIRNGHGGPFGSVIVKDGEVIAEEKGNQKETLKIPANWEEMVKIAEILAKPFPFVRVDFFLANGTYYFAELTFIFADILSSVSSGFFERIISPAVLS